MKEEWKELLSNRDLWNQAESLLREQIAKALCEEKLQGHLEYVGMGTYSCQAIV